MPGCSWPVAVTRTVASSDEVWVISIGHSAFVTGLCFSPDGTKLVSGSGDKTVKIWDISSLDASP